MDDVRNYLKESDSIGDAERILLKNLQKSASNRQQRSVLESNPISETKESSSYRPDVLKISDLLRSVDETEKRRKLEAERKIQPIEEPIVQKPPSLPINPEEIDLYAEEEIFKLEQLKLKIKRDAEDRKLAYERQRLAEEKAFRDKHPEIGTLSETKAQELKRQLQNMQDEYNTKSAQQKANIVIAQRELEAMQSRSLPYRQSSIIKSTLPATARLADDDSSLREVRMSVDDSNTKCKARVDNILSKIADPQFLEEKKQHILSLRNREEQESKHVEAAQAWLKEDMARASVPVTSRKPIITDSMEALPMLQESISPARAPSRNQPPSYNNNSNQSSQGYGEQAPFIQQQQPQQQQYQAPNANNPFFSSPQQQQQPMQQLYNPYQQQQPSYQQPFYQPQPPPMRPSIDPTILQYQRMAEQMEAENQARMSQLQALLQPSDYFGNNANNTNNNNLEGNFKQRGSYDPNKDFPYPLRRDTINPKQEKNGDKNDNNKDKPSKAELQRQEELRILQHDLEKLKRQQELDEFKTDSQRRSLARSKQLEYETWLEDNKRELQRLKMQQVIAKEKKLLDLTQQPVPSVGQNMTSSLPENIEDVSRLKEACGVGLSTIPLSLASGLSVFVDGLSFSSLSKREGLLYRIALGLYDSTGKGIGKLTASSWNTWSAQGIGVTSVEVLPSNLFRSLSANEWNDMKENKAGLRALIELQVKDNDNNSTARGVGWASVLLFTSGNGDELAVNNNCWAVTMRKGLSDPAADPLTPPITTDSNNNGKFLVRIIENREINRATAWTLTAAMTMSTVPTLLTLYSDYLKQTAQSGGVNSPSKPGTASMQSARLQPSSTSTRPNSSSLQPPSQPQQPPQSSKSNRPFTSSSMKAPSTSASTRTVNANNGINSTTTLPPILPKVDEALEETDESPRLLDASSSASLVNYKKQSASKDPSSFWSLGPVLGPPTERYQRGDGIDIYLDSARYLPDNVTITRLSLRIFNSAKEQIGNVFECICDPRSPAHHPRYHFKAELRANAINATATALIRVDTLDASNLQAVCVGYTAMKLFALRDRAQPTQASESNVFVNTGAFQLRLYAGRIASTLPSFNDVSILDGLKAIPCAVFLLRIQEAPKSTDGFSTLSKDDVARDDWQKMNLMQPPLDYPQYNGTATEPSDLELTAYEAKASVLGNSNSSISAEAALLQAMESGRIEHSLPSRPKAAGPTGGNTAAPSTAAASKASSRVSSRVDSTIGSSSSSVLAWTLTAAEINDAILLKAIFPSNTSNDQQTLLTWWKSLMPALEALRRTLDYSLTAPYSVEGGLAINIVGLYNLPQDRIFPQFNSTKSNAGGLSSLFTSTPSIDVNKNNALYIPKVIFSLAPPGLFYGEPPVYDSVRFTRSLDTVNSTVKAPRFRDGFAQFAPAEMASNLYLVVDVRFVKVELPDPKAPAAAAAVATTVDNNNGKQKTSTGIDISIESRTKNYWTIIPIAREKVPGQGYRYVQSGYFQAPLIEGPMPRNVLSSGANSNGILNSGNPYRELCLRLRNNNTAAVAASSKNKKKAGGADVLSDKQLKLSDGASILVQIYNPLVKDLVLPGITAMAEAGGDGPEAQYTTQLVLCAAEGVTGPSTARVERYLYQNKPPPAAGSGAASKINPSDKTIDSLLPKPPMGPAGGVAPGTSPDVAASHEVVLKLANEVFAAATGLENTSL